MFIPSLKECGCMGDCKYQCDYWEAKRAKKNWGTLAPLRHCKTGKPIYDKKGATTAKNRRWNEDHAKLRIYPCNFCNGWHLTSKDKIRKRDRE